MNTPENIKDILKLKPIGTDSWSRPVYEDQNWHLWKDITLGSNNPKLCSVLNDAFDGEPDIPIRRPFTILSKKDRLMKTNVFNIKCWTDTDVIVTIILAMVTEIVMFFHQKMGENT